jgi:hypothetical protein
MRPESTKGLGLLLACKVIGVESETKMAWAGNMMDAKCAAASSPHQFGHPSMNTK